MKLGIDVSTYFEEINNGAKYYKDGILIDPLDEFLKNDVKSMRIRVWVNPYTKDKKKYLGGTCDLDNFLKLSKLAISKGYEVYLDLHYSDFWADPGKQMKPKDWSNLSFLELKQKVYDYTIETLSIIKENNINLKMIQIGNEITNGLLWPDGRLIEHENNPRTNYENLAILLKEGLKACKEIYPNALRMLHLERSYDLIVYEEFFSNMEKYNVPYEVIGASYYPYWHGSIDELMRNLLHQKKLFNKKLVIAEVGYAFTLEDYIKNSNNQLVVNDNNLNNFNMKENYPFTKEGQREFIQDFLRKCIDNGIDEVYYWEPLWIPGDGICWASVEGEEYIGESGKSTRNEWSNQCLFDYKGNMNPGFLEYKVDKK